MPTYIFEITEIHRTAITADNEEDAKKLWKKISNYNLDSDASERVYLADGDEEVHRTVFDWRSELEDFWGLEWEMYHPADFRAEKPAKSAASLQYYKWRTWKDPICDTWNATVHIPHRSRNENGPMLAKGYGDTPIEALSDARERLRADIP